MNRLYLLSAVVTIVAGLSIVAAGSFPVWGQRPNASGIIGPRGELGSRISGERITRQVDVMQLQRSIDQLRSRVERLERQSLSGSALPAFTIEESEAELAYAEAQLAESQQSSGDGDASDLDLAAARLRVVRAQSQLRLARAAHLDARLELEADLTHARRRLLEQTKDQQQMERLVAKGYAPSDSLELHSIDVELARNLVQRLQARLQLYEDAAQPSSPVGQRDETLPAE